MHGTPHRSLVLTALAALILSGGQLWAAEPATPSEDKIVLPQPADVQGLAIYPEKVALKGGDDAAQIVLTAKLKDGRLQDLSGDAKYEPADPKVVRISTSGRIIPLANGNTQIKVTFGDKSLTIPVTAEKVD